MGDELFGLTQEEAQIDPHGVIDADPPAPSQRQMVAELLPYALARAEAKEAKEAQDEIGERIREWLIANPEEKELHDGEHKITAQLIEHKSKSKYDVRAMDQELVLRLWSMGLLELNVTMIDALKGRDVVSLEVRRYEIPGGVTYSLDVRER